MPETRVARIRVRELPPPQASDNTDSARSPSPIQNEDEEGVSDNVVVPEVENQPRVQETPDTQDDDLPTIRVDPSDVELYRSSRFRTLILPNQYEPEPEPEPEEYRPSIVRVQVIGLRHSRRRGLPLFLSLVRRDDPEEFSRIMFTRRIVFPDAVRDFVARSRARRAGYPRRRLRPEDLQPYLDAVSMRYGVLDTSLFGHCPRNLEMGGRRSFY